MTESVDSWPKARKRHRCVICNRFIEPGEEYWRQANFDGNAWTNKTCEHCERAVWLYGHVAYDEWLVDWLFEWLADEYPSVWASMQVKWRFPDGELMPVPFGSRCRDCGCRAEFRRLWCRPCDERRITRLNTQFVELASDSNELRDSFVSLGNPIY